MKKKLVIALLITMLLLTVFVNTASALIKEQDRYYSEYNPTLFNAGFFRYRMNCYGYAITTFYNGSVSATNPYKQQPGEFANKNEKYSSLVNSYINAMTTWNNLYYFVKDRIFEDFVTLGYSIPETTASATVPSNKRKIALVIKQDGINSDFHFYMRHKSGNWSHKRGASDITNKSITSRVTITDSNINSVASEGGYDDGTRYFLIGKDAVIDYPHAYGHGEDTIYTQTVYRDRAGETVFSCTRISRSIKARFDFPNDHDCYLFIPSSSGTYKIETSITNTHSIAGYMYSDHGDTVGRDTVSGNASFTVDLTAGEAYYICFYEKNGAVVDYELRCNKLS